MATARTTSTPEKITAPTTEGVRITETGSKIYTAVGKSNTHSYIF